MKLLICEEVEPLSDEAIALFKRLIEQVEREQNDTRAVRELARNFHLGKLIAQNCKDIEAEWHLQEEIKLVQNVAAYNEGPNLRAYLTLANQFRSKEYSKKGERPLFMAHLMDDDEKSLYAGEIRKEMVIQLAIVSQEVPELVDIIGSMFSSDDDAILNLRREPIAALWKNAKKRLIPESDPEVYKEIEATQKRMKELYKEFNHLHERLKQRRARWNDLLNPIVGRDPMTGILALHPLYREFSNPFLRYNSKPVPFGTHYPDIAVSRPEVWQYLFNKLNEQKPMNDEEHRQAIDFIINFHRKLGRPAPHLSPAAVYFIQKIRPFAERCLNGKQPTFDRAFWASLQTREERTYCLAREFSITLDNQWYAPTWDRKRFLDLLPESEIPQIIEACFQAHRERNCPRKEIHWNTYNEKIEDELTRPEPFQMAMPDMTEEASTQTEPEAEVDEAAEQEISPRWEWVYCIHPHNPTNKPIAFDPLDEGTLSETLKQAKQNAVIKVSSIASAIQLYEEMDSTIRQLLPQENIEGINWHKLKRGSMRILLRGPEGSKPARAHIYDRKDYEWREVS